jgi:putative transposase
MLQPRLGGRKLHHLMKQAGIDSPPGRDRLFALLREHRLLVPVKRAYDKTTQSHHRFRCHPNLTKPGADQTLVQRPEQL